MRNNNNGLINGGYTNNHNVNQILYFNQEAQPVQLTPSPYLTSQTFIAPPQQIPYQPIYNSIPNYYNMGVVNYPTQTTALPYPPIIMKQNSFPSQILPSRLDVVDPNTGNNVNISRPTTPVALPKRRSTLQIIDPVSKNEIDVSKILNKTENLESHKEEDKKDFKFEFNIKTEDIIEEPIKSQENKSIISEEIIEDKIEILPVESEIIPEQSIGDEIEETEIPEINEIKNILEEQELKNILHEINQDDDDDDFTEVVNKKKKKQQAKLLLQEQKSQETKSNLMVKKENSRNQNGSKKDNRNNKVIINDKKEAQISPNNNNNNNNNNSNEDKPKSIPNSSDKQNKTNSINRSGTRIFHNTDKRLERNNQHNDNGNTKSGRNENQYVNRNNHHQGNFPRNTNQQKHLNNRANENTQMKNDQNESKNNENNDANTQQNENRHINIPRNESRNASIQRNENRNASIQRNESRNDSIQRNESRNDSIQRNESRNDSIHRNESRNASIHRNESRNANINQNDNRNTNIRRDENRNANIHHNEGRNTNLHRNESRTSNLHQNDNRNVSDHQNEARNINNNRNDNNKNANIQRNGSRNLSGQQNERRYQNGQKNETIDDQQLNNLENRSSTLPRTQNFSRNDYNRNKFNSNNDNQYDNRNRNNQGINRNYSRNENYRSNNNRKENSNCRDDDSVFTNSANNSRRGSTESKQSEQEFKTPFNKATVKQPMNFQRAFRKSSSPLFSPRHIESDKTGKVSPLIHDSTLLQTNDDSNDLVEQLQELRNLEINDNDNQCADNGSTDVVLENQSQPDTVKDNEIPINKDELSEQISVNEVTNSVVEACVDEVDVSSVMEVEEIIPSDETETPVTMEELKQSIANEIQIETIDVEKIEDSPKEIDTETNEIVLDVEIKDIPIENEDKELGEIEEIGRLTYYRDNLLALRGSQTLPEEMFLDPSLMDVITAKMQLINFLKKKDIFLKSNIPKTDYLDFTRKHYNIRPKRLIRSDNGYLPPQLRKETEDKMIILKRNIKSILNKMTPENFDICMNDLVNLDIDEEENMRCLIDEIFAKAILEESYSSIYAKFCSEMSNARVGSFTFKTLLLKSCQSMFDKPMHLQLEEVKTYWENKVAEEKDERMKRLYESDIEEKVKKAKDKYFGNIRFFSELFLTNQLSWKIIIACAEKLLGFSKDNNSLEAVCKLIQICGKQLDILEKQRGTGDNKFSKVMNQFVALSNKIDIEPRIRFKLKDIVDMRDRGWELRGIQKAIINIPKTLDEIKEDKLKEDSQKVKMSYNNNINTRIRQIPTKSVMDTKKLLLNTQNVTENTVLGPSLRTQWNAGCQSKSNNNGFSTIPFRKQVVTEDVVEKPVMIKTQNKYAKFCDEIDTETIPVAQIPAENDDFLTRELFDLIMNNLAEVDKWKDLLNPVLAVEKWFALMFERKVDCRIKLGDYFYDLIEGGLLTFDQLIQGAMPTLETIDDLIDDVPKFWEFLAEFLERFIKNENSNISFFHDLFKDIDYETSVEKCLKLTKQFSLNRLNSDMVEDLFRKYQK